MTHNAGNIVTENVRQRNFDAGQPVANPDVKVIQRARAHFDQHFIGFDFRTWNFGKLENFRSTVLLEDDRFHDAQRAKGKERRAECRRDLPTSISLCSYLFALCSSPLAGHCFPASIPLFTSSIASLMMSSARARWPPLSDVAWSKLFLALSRAARAAVMCG